MQTTSSTPPPVVPDPAFLKRVEEAAGTPLSPCFQCVKCSGGCPMTFAMDILPNRLIRMVQFGLKDEVLRSHTIWLCASCETCVTRCPNEVDLPHVMDTLRSLSIADGVAPSEPAIRQFHEAFLDEVKAGGRVHELRLVGRFKRRTGRWFQDVGLGLKMFGRGKLKLLPSRTKEREWIRRADSGSEKCKVKSEK